MNTVTTPTKEAILLLNVSFGSGASAKFKPLSEGQYRELALWLKSRDQSPADLLGDDQESILEDWTRDYLPTNARIKKPSREQILYLLQRGSELSLAVEKWAIAGLWVLTRADRELYPQRLRKRLGSHSPAVLFGCGDVNLLNMPGIAVVGSRRANHEELEYCQQLGAHLSAEKAAVISGAARGVDITTMKGAMAAGGAAIGIMPDGLLRHSSSPEYKEQIAHGRLALISPFHPEAQWRSYQAMMRNRLIYALSDAAIVVASVEGSGGTWKGAVENLTKAWVPLWVRKTNDPASGNAALVGKGARWLANPFPSYETMCSLEHMGN